MRCLQEDAICHIDDGVGRRKRWLAHHRKHSMTFKRQADDNDAGAHFQLNCWLQKKYSILQIVDKEKTVEQERKRGKSLLLMSRRSGYEIDSKSHFFFSSSPIFFNISPE